MDTNKQENIIIIMATAEFLKRGTNKMHQGLSRIGLDTFYTIYIQPNVNDDVSCQSLSFTLSMNTHTPSLDQ